MDQYLGHPYQKFGATSYSQHGEDLYFMNLVRDLNLSKPTYLDLGAYHPTTISNTALLYQNGARGINIEANPFLIQEFDKKRPDDLNLRIGVGPQSGTFEFYLLDDLSAINSFRESSFAQHGHRPIRSISTPVWTLHDIVGIYSAGKYPDFLFTDIEDLDYEVLAGSDFSKSRPKIICTEMRKEQQGAAVLMMSQKGFHYLCRFSENMIFVHDEYHSKVI